jgi:hypothetical protein
MSPLRLAHETLAFQSAASVAVIPAAHLGHTHATPRCAGGTRSSTDRSMRASRHQQAVAKLPLRAGAHSLGPPQMGQA